MQKATVTLDLEKAKSLAADFKVCVLLNQLRGNTVWCISLQLVTHLHIVQICRSECTKPELWNTEKTSLHELPYLHVWMEVKSVVIAPWMCQKTGVNGGGTYKGLYEHWGGTDGFIPCNVTAGSLDIITEGSAWSAVTDFADICLWPANTWWPRLK